MERLRFISLASGSSGNCYYIGNQFHGVLVDAGLGPRTIKKRLKEVGLDLSQVMAVFVTHDHVDHIKGVGTLAEKHHIPVYTTRLVHEGMARCYGMTEKLSNASKRFLEKGETVSIFDFYITAFGVSHDSTDSVGYTIQYRGKRFTVATDLGHICDSAAEHIVKADFLVIEANYDEQMLQSGHYPYHLKKRVAANTGHMDNKHTAVFLAENYHQNLKYVYLCHLSKDNNRPEIAFEAVREKLHEKGILVGEHLSLMSLERTVPSQLFVFED